MKVMIKIGIMPKEQYQQRVMDIAAGRYKPRKGEPKIWFSSMKSFAEVMNDKNKVLLDIIRQQKPQSVSELAELSGRHKSNLSRTLKTMEKLGLVEMKKRDHTKVPVVTAEQFELRAEF